MFAKVCAFVAFCVLTGQSQAQECVAQNVVTLRLDAKHNLTWYILPGEPCQIDEYLVDIFHPLQPAKYSFSVKERHVDVSFLEVCEAWVFVVIPVSGHTMGAERRMMTSIPLPPEADLSLDYLDVTHNIDTGRTHLHWDMTEKRQGDCSLKYRVTVEEAGSPVIEDFYVESRNQLDLHFLSSCTTYQFGVRAINIAEPTIEGPLMSAIHSLPGRTQGPPVVIDVQSSQTSVNISFRLESEVRNPCLLRALFVDGGAAISQTIALSNEGTRRPVNVTLTNLEPDTTYLLRVYVSNIVGWSNATELAVHTLEEYLDEEPSDAVEETD